MQQTKHTPGPWKPIITKLEAQYFQITAGNGTIVGYSVGGMPFELQRANANLLATAPELLAAAKYTYRLLMGVPGLIDKTEALKQLEKVIRKAEGITID